MMMSSNRKNPRYWPFMRGNHWWPVNSQHKGQWRGALMLSLICVWINGYVNNREGGDLRRHRAHYDVDEMMLKMKEDVFVCNVTIRDENRAWATTFTFDCRMDVREKQSKCFKDKSLAPGRRGSKFHAGIWNSFDGYLEYPVTDEFPAQMASKAEMFPFDNVIMILRDQYQRSVHAISLWSE